MLSGIGPEEELEALGIRTLVALPGVGQNFHDHVMCELRFRGARTMSDPECAWEVGVFYTSGAGLIAPDCETIYSPTVNMFLLGSPEDSPAVATMEAALVKPVSRVGSTGERRPFGSAHPRSRLFEC